MSEKPALFLLDLMMPKQTGFDVLRYLKQNNDLRNIPVVVMTNLASQEHLDKALELGAVTYLIKGQYGAKEIVVKIQEIIDAHGTGDKLEVPETKVLVRELPGSRKKKKADEEKK